MIALFLYILVPVLAAIIVNVIVLLQNRKNKSLIEPNRSALLPPAIVIAIVWVLILGALGASFWALGPTNNNMYTIPSHSLTIARIALVLLVVYCISYPFITGLHQKTTNQMDRSRRRTRLANLAGLLLSVLAICLIIGARATGLAIGLALPVLLWTSYVSFTDAFADR